MNVQPSEYRVTVGGVECMVVAVTDVVRWDWYLHHAERQLTA